MEHLLKGGQFGRIVICTYKNNPLKYGSSFSHRHCQRRNFTSLWGGRALERSRHSPHCWTYQRREYGMLVVRALRGVLKIRYLLLGGAVAGGSALNKKYQDWRDGLPDLKWLDDVLPDNEKWQQWRGELVGFKDSVKNNIEIDPKIKALTEAKYNQFKMWFDQRLDDAIAATEQQELQNGQKQLAETVEETKERNTVFTKGEQRASSEEKLINNLQERIKSLETEMIQDEIARKKLEKENKELRKQNILLRQNHKPTQMRKIKRSLIDMYSEVLDELSEFDSGVDMQDHLPRVVVVGDQSSGKTSVLEMLAQARIFPRGGGEMMTRAPVKVTLSEGPYHVAQFRDSAREYDLTKESDLADLRKEVEYRMKKSIKGGKTVSNEVISMTLKGPGLQRMVLVDLPGIISTQMTDMAQDTRECIRQMALQYMKNPNAIILCIQDGSVDAERSNVTDLVSQCDPTGKRTIFVLTKVDAVADKMAQPNRIKKILSGELLPMKALGYFAVVTGRGREDDSIQAIEEYESSFFKNSKLFQDGSIRSTQCTTRKLSLAVADCFWKMVRESVEQQADAFKARRFNLEAEWKNKFPRLREQDRDELFERARAEILDEVVNLSQVGSKQWDDCLLNKIWEKVSDHVFENVYLPAAQTGSTETFNTTVDIKLRTWAEHSLPALSVESAWETLQSEFKKFMLKTNQAPDHDDIFDTLKAAVVNEAMQKHKWEDKAAETLKVIQLNTLEDSQVSDKKDWDAAVKFLETSVKTKLQQTEDMLKEILGPSTRERWLYWKYQTDLQAKNNAVKSELDKILYSNERHGPQLSFDELTTVRNNLLRNGLEEIDNEFIRQVWFPVYRRHFLKQSLAKAYDCRKSFYLYHNQQNHNGKSSSAGMSHHDMGLDCSDVVLFHRVQKMMQVTAKSLRQQIINREARRLDKEIREVLEDYSQDGEKKKQLLTGRRVTLAEELKRVRQIQEKLEEFIQALNKEK